MTGDVQSDLRHPAILATALVTVCLWAAAAGRMLRARAGDWQAGSRPLRAWWLAGWVMLLVHIAAAFHVAHGWSHAVAYEHTERTAGVGEGLYVNYLFALVWGADAIWFGVNPRSYTHRPWWVGWAVHGFLSFVTFNATVVYGTGLAQWLGAFWFALLGWYWVRRARSS